MSGATMALAKPHAATVATQTEKRSVSAQNDWLTRIRGQVITARLSDGKTLTGILTAYDDYTLILTITGQEVPILLFKQNIAFLMRKAD